MNPTFNFTNKTILITGGVSGIGAATSFAFKRAGANVIACGITDQEIDAAKTNPDFAGIRIERLDVRYGEAVTRLIGSLPSLDCVVNSAGIIRRLAEHDPKVFEEVIDVNVTGGMRVASAARPLLAKSKGSTVLIGSVMSDSVSKSRRYFVAPPCRAFALSASSRRVSS